MFGKTSERKVFCLFSAAVRPSQHWSCASSGRFLTKISLQILYTFSCHFAILRVYSSLYRVELYRGMCLGIISLRCPATHFVTSHQEWLFICISEVWNLFSAISLPFISTFSLCVSKPISLLSNRRPLQTYIEYLSARVWNF